MKRFASIAAFALVLTGAGATGSIAAVVTHTTMTSQFTSFNACTGESVLITGEVQFLSTAKVTDNTISGTLHSVFKATGTGLTSGLQYQEIVVFNRAFETSLLNGEATVTQVGLIKLITPGGGNDLTSPIFLHTTFDANGDLASSRTEFGAPTCA